MFTFLAKCLPFLSTIFFNWANFPYFYSNLIFPKFLSNYKILFIFLKFLCSYRLIYLHIFYIFIIIKIFNKYLRFSIKIIIFFTFAESFCHFVNNIFFNRHFSYFHWNTMFSVISAIIKFSPSKGNICLLNFISRLGIFVYTNFYTLHV